MNRTVFSADIKPLEILSEQDVLQNIVHWLVMFAESELGTNNVTGAG